VPRGADTCSAENKPVSDSTIIKGSIGGGLATGGTIASQIGSASGTVTDTVTTVTGTVTSTVEAGKVVHSVVKPFLGLMPEVWLGIGIACGVIALGYFIYIGVRRYLMHRRDGV
jgi:hypothetical protein